jgi:hypothetical protein
MPKGHGLSKAMQYRRQAAACGLLAAGARAAADRELLLHLQRSLLEHACHEDWVDGLPPIPPGQSRALAVPRRSWSAHFVLTACSGGSSARLSDART